MTESGRARWWAFGLALMTILAAMLVVVVNPFEAALAYLALLLGVIVVGLLTSVWGGLAASALSVFVIVLVNQYAGIFPRENAILNVATELAAYLLVGPLAGGLAGAIDRVQREADRYLARVEELTVHDETFGTLKPDWAAVRLDEEILRARCFNRSLSIALLQLDPKTNTIARSERIAALQATIRVARAVTQPPIVVSHAGGDQVLIVLPEHTLDQAQLIADSIRAKFLSEKYFPKGSAQSLGKPIGDYGNLKLGLSSLKDRSDTAQIIIERANQSLHGSIY
jgi:GGDEF domain-containing protein